MRSMESSTGKGFNTCIGAPSQVSSESTKLKRICCIFSSFCFLRFRMLEFVGQGLENKAFCATKSIYAKIFHSSD